MGVEKAYYFCRKEREKDYLCKVNKLVICNLYIRMKILEFCKKYKYILTLLVFVAYLIFGENNVAQSYKLNTEIKRLESELQDHNDLISNTKNQNILSSYSTKEDKEEYFRKQHHYKKENEDIFRIVEED